MIKIERVRPEDNATREFICEFRAIVEAWEGDRVVHATPVRNIDELLDAVEHYEQCEQLLDCDCDKLPDIDMDGSTFQGRCRVCEETEDDWQCELAELP